MSPPSPLHGVALFVAATAVLSLMDVSAKQLAQELSFVQVAWSRYFGHVAIAAALLLPRRGLALLSTRRLPMQLFRSALLLACTLLFFAAISIMPLADAVAISFLSPLLVVALAAPLLGERIGVKRWIAVAIGFGGAMAIVRPGAGVVHWGAVLVLIMCFTYALYLVTTRMLAATEDAATTLFYSGLIGAVPLTLALPWFWTTPSSLLDWLLLAGLGLLGAVGHWLVIRAHDMAQAATLAPLNYVSLVWAAMFGFVVFGDFPDGVTLIGAAVLIGTGIYVVSLERRGGPLPAKAASGPATAE
jgi:drug/metabolite transporter (DMT)-like permease